MDDMILWAQEKHILQDALASIDGFLQTQLHVHLKPPQLNRCQRGVPFLGYRVFPYQLKLSQRSKRRFVKKYLVLSQQLEQGQIDEHCYHRQMGSMLAFLRHADSHAFRKKLIFPREGWSS